MSKKEQEKTLLEKYTLATIEFVKQHAKVIIAVSVVVILIAVGLVSAVFYVENHEKKILTEYSQILDDYQKTMQNQDASDSEKIEAAVKIVELTDSAQFGYIKKNGYYIAGGIYFQNANYTEAKKYFDLFLEKSSTSELAPLAMFQSAVCSEWLAKTEDAFLIYKQMEADYQDTKYMERVIYDIARLYAKKGKMDKSREYFNRVLTEYPGSQYATQSKKRLMLLNLEN